MDKGAVLILMLSSSGACTVEPRKQKPPIAARLEGDGAGDLTVGTKEDSAGAPVYVIQGFLMKQGKDYIAAIHKECEGLRVNMPQGWNRSVDMRICAVAARLNRQGGGQ